VGENLAAAFSHANGLPDVAVCDYITFFAFFPINNVKNVKIFY
jgi:hypothetical protein